MSFDDLTCSIQFNTALDISICQAFSIDSLGLQYTGYICSWWSITFWCWTHLFIVCNKLVILSCMACRLQTLLVLGNGYGVNQTAVRPEQYDQNNFCLRAKPKFSVQNETFLSEIKWWTFLFFCHFHILSDNFPRLFWFCLTISLSESYERATPCERATPTFSDPERATVALKELHLITLLPSVSTFAKLCQLLMLKGDSVELAY